MSVLTILDDRVTETLEITATRMEIVAKNQDYETLLPALVHLNSTLLAIVMEQVRLSRQILVCLEGQADG